MRKLNLIAILGILALVGAGSAALTDIYGTMSGTADIKPAVKMMEVQYNPSDDSTQEYIAIVNRAGNDINLTEWNITDGSGTDELKIFNSTYETELQTNETAYITEAEGESEVEVPHNVPRLSTGDTAIAASGLASRGETLELVHPDDVTTSSVDYSDADCNTDESYQRDSYDAQWKCDSASIGGGSQ